MSTTKKAAGGLSLLGVVGFIVHLLHNGFNIYEYNHKKTYSTDPELVQRAIFASYGIENLDSIMKIEDTGVRDFLIKKALKEKQIALYPEDSLSDDSLLTDK